MGIGLKVIKNCASKKTNKIFIYNKDFKVIPHKNMNKFISERDFFLSNKFNRKSPNKKCSTKY